MRVGRRCFVSNLAWRTSWQDLKDKFRDCGEVVYANVIRDDSGELPPRASPAAGTCLGPTPK
jgi:RNA recognition motif-containing protein